jgi:hypothetical protein
MSRKPRSKKQIEADGEICCHAQDQGKCQPGNEQNLLDGSKSPFDKVFSRKRVAAAFLVLLGAIVVAIPASLLTISHFWWKMPPEIRNSAAPDSILLYTNVDELVQAVKAREDFTNEINQICLRLRHLAAEIGGIKAGLATNLAFQAELKDKPMSWESLLAAYPALAKLHQQRLTVARNRVARSPRPTQISTGGRMSGASSYSKISDALDIAQRESAIRQLPHFWDRVPAWIALDKDKQRYARNYEREPGPSVKYEWEAAEDELRALEYFPEEFLKREIDQIVRTELAVQTEEVRRRNAVIDEWRVLVTTYAELGQNFGAEYEKLRAAELSAVAGLKQARRNAGFYGQTYLTPNDWVVLCWEHKRGTTRVFTLKKGQRTFHVTWYPLPQVLTRLCGVIPPDYPD